jgi:DNA-binding SARP family transcriptional activator
MTLGGLRLSASDGAVVMRRRNDLAVLVVLADRSPAALRREEVQALFWGERAEEKARHSLRQVVLQLRRAVGDVLEVDAASLRLTAGHVAYDVREFNDAANQGRYREAADLWVGDFLMGCEDIGAEGFRAWLDVERERLRRLLDFCYERAVIELETSGAIDQATTYAQRWADQFPLDERAQRRSIELLCAAGRLADATSARGAFIRRLATEMDEAPSSEWLSATEQMLRAASSVDVAGVRARSVKRAAAARVADDVASSAPPAASVAGAPARRSMMPLLAAAAVVILSAMAVLGARIAMTRDGRQPTLAVGKIGVMPASDSLDGFGTLLAITLARIPGLDLISERRMSEVAVGRRSADLTDVARAAGAREIIDGVLTRLPNGSLRADLKRSDLATGKTRGAYTVEGTDLTQLADFLTEQVARDLKVPAPVTRREGTTNSIVAYRFYEQGLRAYSVNDGFAARRLFAAALVEDTTFAMAALYQALLGGDSTDAYYARALRHARATSERERLFISVEWGRRMADPRVLSWADTLLTRYPSEPDAHLAYAQGLLLGANRADALPHFRRVVEMDSSSASFAAHCRACDAVSGMIDVYRSIDSLPEADHWARTWLKWQPNSERAWSAYSSVLGESNRFAEAHAAVDSANKYLRVDDPLSHTVWWFRNNEYEAVDRAWRYAEQSDRIERRLDGLWTHVIASRTQGRLRDALSAAREYTRVRAKNGTPNAVDGLLEAVVLAESGQPRAAAAMYDSMARAQHGPSQSKFSATKAWYWTHEAGAAASAGDTATLRRLEDSVRASGALATERYKRLHHYVRGLRLELERKPDDAAAEFRQAVWVRQSTHVRIYAGLARSLTAAGRPREAVAPLVEALKGPVSAAGLYATRTELQQLLAEAYDKSDQRDSAITQYRLVSRAWRHADPQFDQRRAAVETRIAALTLSAQPTSQRSMPR